MYFKLTAAECFLALFFLLLNMSPSITSPSEEFTTDQDLDLQKWLKEIEGAENLMTEVETKADLLQVKIDALLQEVTKQEPEITKNDTQEK